ncbi:UNVERIFIED_CONTAM: putative inactive ATP-dependent zinc metalloprotease FTSHI 2, chloroplastic [Sesamum calycinum]|uniref:Inactive ATP-dependent zinc metalloprotease FTSHI 2, chloroplastic n=1 Tax=Sesamum calycinum TaxID=2727403 RepID=A0AAW2SWI4_9LAMI
MAGIEAGDDEEEGGKEDDNPYMKMAEQFMKSGARVRRAQNRRLPQYLERGVDVKFSDVAGLGKIRLELEEIVKFFTHGEMYRRRGVKIPGVNFFSISASQFVEIYVGVGASRVRALYQEAKENAPSVVFIDELDAVGRKRGLIKGSGGQERDATLNQVHARKKPMAPDVDYTAVASITDGMVGAELANIIEVAAINMMRDGRTEITTDDLLQAAQIEERGMLDRKERSPEAWKQVAINEAAMALVAVNFPDLKNIEFVTIAPRAGRELGYVRMKMDHIKFKEGMLSRQSLLDHITVQLAPRAADELWYGKDQLSTIWAETTDNARSAARTFVLGGLSEKHYGLNNFWIEDRINYIDSEALRILEACYERAKSILQQNRALMDAIVNTLVEKKSLTKQEFFNLVDLYGSIQPMPPSILDIRSAKRLELQNTLENTIEEALQGSR